MIKPAAVRRLALSLPETEEKSHFEQPDFRVRNKIFATLSTDRKQTWVKVTHDDMVALSQADPETFEAQPWGRSFWLGVRLERADPDELRELIVESWRNVAPKRVVAAFDDGTS